MTTLMPPGITLSEPRKLRSLTPSSSSGWAPSRPAPIKRPAVIIGMFMLGTTVFSSVLLAGQSLRLDEAQSLWQTSHSFGRMYELVAQDVHVPLYHTILRLWESLFGTGVVAVRSLSLLFLVLTIPAVYALARRVVDERSSLFAAALVTLSPFMQWYGAETRMYTLLALLAVVNQRFFLAIFQGAAGRNWLGYSLTAVAGIYTHYFFWLGLVTQGVFFLAYRRRFPRRTGLRLVGVAGGLLVAISPWLVFARSQGGSGGSQPLLQAPSSVDLFNTFSQFAFGFQNDRLNTLVVALWPLMVLFALLAVQKAKRLPAEVGYFLLAGLLPIALAFAVSVLVRPVYSSRYLIVSLPPLFIFSAWLLTVYGRRVRRVLRTALVAGLVVTSAHQALASSTPTKEDFRAASSYLAGAAGPQDIVVVSPPFTTYPFSYYFAGPAAVTTLPAWNRFEAGAAPAFDPRTLSAQVKQLSDRHHDAWLVLSYDQGYESAIVKYFDAHYTRLELRQLSPGLAVYRYRLRYDIPDTKSLISSLNAKAHS